MFVVLARLVATILQQMHYNSSHRSSGSPQSLGLNPKCSHTAAVAFGFETIFVFHSPKSQLAFSMLAPPALRERLGRHAEDGL